MWMMDTSNKGERERERAQAWRNWHGRYGCGRTTFCANRARSHQATLNLVAPSLERKRALLGEKERGRSREGERGLREREQERE